MSETTAKTVTYSPLALESRPLVWQIAAVIAGTLVLTLSSYISVPMYPVPVTMQTYAILMVAALYGWRLGALTVLAWLGQAALGMPVLAGGSGGLPAFAGPTAGYIFSWPLITAFVGWLAERGWNGRRPVLAFAAMVAAGTFCLAMGTAWLAGFIGVDKAIEVGFLPFIPGDVLKAALGAATLMLLSRKAKGGNA
ncbi:biotin transporter BioY [Pelagibacterium xiamenense]|uniref:biotin transporter BioY n=1 Tax=Pelagibacterium xiamenense TaxID=2901140 RepID=UPI001E2F97FC|nr:biotin transporter BioY [Pelagibacterium xiamenense]MCD7060469.1 biotin transporter BioY [Pelagibacterium xiamenense]